MIGILNVGAGVIAHLMLMRGDEPMFWRRANQHPVWTKGAALG
jgi:hypothetical protein